MGVGDGRGVTAKLRDLALCDLSGRAHAGEPPLGR